MTVSPFLNVAPIASQESTRASQSPIAEFAVNCELVRGAEDRILDELTPRVKQGSVALDLSNVERIDAAGIAVLITLYCTAIEAGTEFYIVSPSAHVLDLLRLVGLESILVPVRNRTEARESKPDHSKFERSAA